MDGRNHGCCLSVTGWEFNFGGSVWMVRQRQCARLSFAWSLLYDNGFGESTDKEKLRPGQCFAVMRFDSHARHIRPLENTASQIFARNVMRGREWQQCFTWCSIGIMFCSAATGHTRRWFTSEARSAGLLLSSFLTREHPLHFLRERRKSFPFWEDVLRESFLMTVLTWVHC